MTTPTAARRYLASHLAKWGGKPPAIFNPDDGDVEDLPVIYGFNNGGSPGWFHGCLVAEDGTGLGGHICSNEAYMLHDLGVIEGSRPDRHETFRKHYPNGYRMEFVSYDEAPDHDGLQAALALNRERAAAAEREDDDG